MLTKEEIKKIKDNVVVLTFEDIIRVITTGKIKIIRPIFLNNGYTVGYSIERIRPSLDIHHISVSNSKGETDPAEAEHIARDFLGKKYESIGPMGLKNVLHFIKYVEQKSDNGHMN